VERRTEAFFFAKVADGTAQKSTSVAGRLPRKSPHYGISVCREAPEAAWMLTFRAPLWKNPHKIWRKCFAGDEGWYRIRSSRAFLLLTLQGGLRMATGMTKTQLVRHMAEKNELNNKQAAAFLDGLAEVAIKETKKNGVFIIPGLGRLVKSARKARMGRNPQTGEAIKIPAKTVVKFRVAKAAKDAIAPKK
jgi:DNA-binding protein HU-beta